MRAAIAAYLRDGADPHVALRRLELTATSAADLLDETAVERLTTVWIVAELASTDAAAAAWKMPRVEVWPVAAFAPATGPFSMGGTISP